MDEFWDDDGEVEEVVRRCNGKGLKGFLSFHFSDIVQLEEVSSFLGELFEDDGRCFSVLSLSTSSLHRPSLSLPSSLLLLSFLCRVSPPIVYSSAHFCFVLAPLPRLLPLLSFPYFFLTHNPFSAPFLPFQIPLFGL